jgi:predicted RNA binding protein YcfA (HicA-like mRNA interferase family)
MSRLPSVKPRELVAALKKDGFVEHHQKGSHLYLWHPAKRRMTTVPMHPGDVNRGLVQAILKQADLTTDEFLKLL